MSKSIDAILDQNEQRNKQYLGFVENYTPKQSTFVSLLKAGVVGGIICCIGQLIFDLHTNIGNVDKMLAGNLTSMYLILITVILTGLGIFDKLGSFAGGGTFLPISGFANSVASAALEYKSEGLIFGLSAKYFTVAGPVIINGIMGSFIIGLVYWIISLF